MGQLISLSTMKPLGDTGLHVGQRVQQVNKYKDGTVVDIDPHFGVPGAYVIFDDGDFSHGQTLDARSPFLRVRLTDEPDFTAEQIEALKQKRLDKMAADKLAEDQAAAQKRLDTEKFIAELRAKYPDAETKGSSHARAAKNMKRELIAAFPGVKFTVKSQSYSGGDSIHVGWTDGPTVEQVRKYSEKYQCCSFDGMTDSENYDRSAFMAAVTLVLGDAKYVSESRSFSDQARIAVESYFIKQYELPLTANADQRNANAQVEARNCWLSDLVYRSLRISPIPVGGVLTGMGFIEDSHYAETAMFTVPVIKSK